MKRLIFLFALLVIVSVISLQQPTDAQVRIYDQMLNNPDTIFVRTSVTNDDISGYSGDLLFIVKYFGDEESGTLDLVSGDLAFYDGTLAAETIDSQIQTIADTYHDACGVALGIDLAANAACDTYGEVADIVNASDDWRMVLVQAMRADTWVAVGAEITDPGDAQCKLPGGLAVYSDTSDNKYITSTAYPHYASYTAVGLPEADIEPFIGSGGAGGVGGAVLREDMLDGYRMWAVQMEVRDSDGDADNAVITFYSQELDDDYTQTTLWALQDLGADDTWNMFTPATVGNFMPVMALPGELLVVRMSTANMDTGDNEIRMLWAFEPVDFEAGGARP